MAAGDGHSLLLDDVQSAKRLSNDALRTDSDAMMVYLPCRCKADTAVVAFKQLNPNSCSSSDI